MIRNEKELGEAIKLISQQKDRLSQQQDRLKGEGLTREQIARVQEPMESFLEDLEDDVRQYEAMKIGKTSKKEYGINELGQAIIALRLAQGLTQRELAARLKVNEAQVSRNERNAYRGLTLDRAARIFEALGVDLKVRVKARKPVLKVKAKARKRVQQTAS
jgi:DNA-directed RNA polymerase specialized sigma subunit